MDPTFGVQTLNRFIVDVINSLGFYVICEHMWAVILYKFDKSMASYSYK